MPTQAAVRQAVDDRLASLWTNQIVPRQNVFFGNRGRYWQGIITGTIPSLPNNTTTGGSTLEVTPNTSARPTDQAETWLDAQINLESTIPMVIAIDVYNGPRGHGYVGRVWVRWEGNVYTRSRNNGPETWRTIGWQQMAPNS